MVWGLSIVVAILCVVLIVWMKRKQDDRNLKQHCITPEELHTMLSTDQEVLLYDVRQPLDLLVDSEIIPGAKRIPPKELLEDPGQIPKEKDSVVYCTCPSDKTSRAVSKRAHALHHDRIKFLRGGLAAWKARGYPVEPYQKSFHLDTRT